MARQFFGQGLAAWREPGFGHDLRWRAAESLRRLLSPDVRASFATSDPRARLLSRLPAEFSRWSPLAQDQYLEVRTLLSGYLLSAQGDRMLMAHSVEGRFPFLDRHVTALADSLPARFKLSGLDEKHVLKRVAAAFVPPEILARPKQPYRAPDALAFAGSRCEWIDEMTGPAAVTAAGVFAPAAAERVMAKCRARGRDGQFSNVDNIAVVGLLSTQLVFDQFIRARPAIGPAVPVRTLVDRLSEHTPVGDVERGAR